QLRRRRLLDGMAQDRRVTVRLAVAGVAPDGERSHERLGYVLEDGKAACHVAVQRRVPGRELALVARREKQPAELVGERHEQHTADAGLQVLLRYVRLAPLECGRECLPQGIERALDRDRERFNAQVAAERERVGSGMLTR